MNKFRILKLWW